MIEMLYDNSNQRCDFITNSDGTLIADGGLETYVLLCMYTEKGSWWADPNFGSTIHELYREKRNEATRQKLVQAIQNCLQPLIAEDMAAEINVGCTLNRENVFDATIEVLTSTGDRWRHVVTNTLRYVR